MEVKMSRRGLVILSLGALLFLLVCCGATGGGVYVSDGVSLFPPRFALFAADSNGTPLPQVPVEPTPHPTALPIDTSMATPMPTEPVAQIPTPEGAGDDPAAGGNGTPLDEPIEAVLDGDDNDEPLADPAEQEDPVVVAGGGINVCGDSPILYEHDIVLPNGEIRGDGLTYVVTATVMTALPQDLWVGMGMSAAWVPDGCTLYISDEIGPGGSTLGLVGNGEDGTWFNLQAVEREEPLEYEASLPPAPCDDPLPLDEDVDAPEFCWSDHVVEAAAVGPQPDVDPDEPVDVPADPAPTATPMPTGGVGGGSPSGCAGQITLQQHDDGSAGWTVVITGTMTLPENRFDGSLIVVPEGCRVILWDALPIGSNEATPLELPAGTWNLQLVERNGKPSWETQYPECELGIINCWNDRVVALTVLSD
jgi:hypothetical protein